MRDKIRMITFVLVLASVLTVVLLVVDGVTAPRIARNEEVKTKKSILGALGIMFTDDDLDAVFEKSVSEATRLVVVAGQTKEMTFYRGEDGSVAFSINGSGMQGPIKAVLAVRADCRTIKGVTIVKQKETP